MNPGDRFRCWFLGVSTRGSAALAAFPGWMRSLGLEGELEPIDLPLDVPPKGYRELLARLRASRGVSGVVVTAHKVRLFEAAHRVFDDMDEMAELCREVSVVRRDRDRLVASAIEPRSAARALAEIVGPSEPCPELLVLGAGGTATALLAHLYALRSSPVSPRAVHLVDIRPERARALQDALGAWSPEVTVETLSPAEAYTAMARLEPGSLIVNATGVGKDRPGSPVALPAPWPRRAVVWDLNYRGELSFLADARRAAGEKKLRVHDGWRLFLHGWSEALACLLERSVTASEFERIERAALDAFGAGPSGYAAGMGRPRR